LSSGGFRQPFGDAELSLGCQSAFEDVDVLAILTLKLAEALELRLEAADFLFGVVRGAEHLARGWPGIVSAPTAAVGGTGGVPVPMG